MIICCWFYHHHHRFYIYWQQTLWSILSCLLLFVAHCCLALPGVCTWNTSCIPAQITNVAVREGAYLATNALHLGAPAIWVWGALKGYTPTVIRVVWRRTCKNSPGAAPPAIFVGHVLGNQGCNPFLPLCQLLHVHTLFSGFFCKSQQFPFPLLYEVFAVCYRQRTH